MKSLLFYILQVIICSGILYGYYHFALRNKKFHSYNRYYLLAAVIISITIPFLNIPVYFSPVNEQIAAIQTLKVIFLANNERAGIHSSTNLNTGIFTWENIFKLFYFLLAGFIFIRFLIGLFYIRSLLRKYIAEKLDRIYFINTEEPGTPFSFFKWIFWNKKIDLQSGKGEQIFRHELFHIQQRHSWDIIFIELLIAVFWINPFFYLIKKEVRAIHEFLADEFAVNENDKWSYAELLLLQVLSAPHKQLINSFFHNHLKRRIAMITSSKKPGYQYLRKLMVLPVATFVVALFAFTYKTKHNKIESQLLNKEQTKDDASQPKKILLTDNKGNIDSRNIILKNATIKDKHGKMSYLPSLTAPMFYKDTVKPLDGVLFVINGKERPDIKSTSDLDSIMTPNEIGTIKILKGSSAIAKYGEKGKKGVIEIDTKGQKEEIKVNGNNKVHKVIVDEKKEAKIDNIISEKVEKVEEVEVDEKKETKIDNIIFEKVEIDPSFPGGEIAWRKFLEKNLKSPAAAKNDAPEGAYTVWIEFIVNKEGEMSDFRALTNHGYGMEEEALRVMKLSPKWIPAKQNGHIVIAFRKQPVTFVIGRKKETVAISNSVNNSMLNTLYIGVDNGITMSTPGTKPENLLVKNIKRYY